MLCKRIIIRVHTKRELTMQLFLLALDWTTITGQLNKLFSTLSLQKNGLLYKETADKLQSKYQKAQS